MNHCFPFGDGWIRSNVFVNACHAFQIVFEVALVGGASLFFFVHSRYVERSSWPPIVLHPVNAIAYLVCGSNCTAVGSRTFGSIAVVFEKTVRFRDVYAIV